MSGPKNPSTSNQPVAFSRRTLLRGAAAATLVTAAGGATPSVASAIPSPTLTDYPGAQWLPADPSNYRIARRPHSHAITYVVVHVTEESFDDTVASFQTPARQSSAHYLIRSADGHIGQCVREEDIAWHATSSHHDDHSIGISHEGWVNSSLWFTEEMYESSAALTAAMCARYAIPPDRTHVLGHSEVSSHVHTDPGANWDWDHYLGLVRSLGSRRR